MKPHQQHRQTSDVSGRVRQNAGSAALAAVCLLFFGFYSRYVIPDIRDLLTLGGAIFNYTLPIGGTAMAIVAAWLWTGHLKALLFDSIASAVIGVLLIASGLMIKFGGQAGINPWLYVLFGCFFVSAGVRNWREYVQLAAPTETGSHKGADSYDPGFERRYQDARSAPSGPSLASRLLERADKTADTTASPELPTPSEPQEPSEPQALTRADQDSEPRASARADNKGQCADQESATMPASSPAESGQDQASEETAASPPEGYLAQFAKENPPDTP